MDPKSSEREKERPGRLVRYVPVVLWIGVIFFLSSSQGSMSQTSRFLRPLLEFLMPGAAEATLVLIHGLIRKFAHFAEYFVLGLLASAAFSAGGISALARYWYLFVLGLVLLVASADEFGQSFNPSRTGSPLDVMIDLAGGAAAVLLWLLLNKIRRSQPS